MVVGIEAEAKRRNPGKAKRGSKPLYEEGDMLHGLVCDAQRDGLEFGLSDKKVPWHHFGYTPNNPPARELVGVSLQDEQMILEELQAYIEESWEG